MVLNLSSDIRCGHCKLCTELTVQPHLRLLLFGPLEGSYFQSVSPPALQSPNQTLRALANALFIHIYFIKEKRQGHT